MGQIDPMYEQPALSDTEYALAARIGWTVILLVMLITMITGAYLGYTSRAQAIENYQATPLTVEVA